MQWLLAFLLLSAPAKADKPTNWDAQDPICDNVDDFRKEFDLARPLHLKHRQLRDVTELQNRLFGAITGEMTSICAAEAKFAADLLARDRSDLTGQCKPAEETAFYDQQMLEHSEANVKMLKSKKQDFLFKEGIKAENLFKLYLKDQDALNEFAFTLAEVPFSAGCELKWLYPALFLKKTTEITGCQELPGYNKPLAQDKKDPALFSKLLNRFDLSVAYNKARRDRASAAAATSLAKFAKCIAEFPGYSPKLLKLDPSQGRNSRPKIGKKTPKNKGSTITGVEDDKKKRDQAK